jgi:hypothetical protein
LKQDLWLVLAAIAFLLVACDEAEDDGDEEHSPADDDETDDDDDNDDNDNDDNDTSPSGPLTIVHDFPPVAAAGEPYAYTFEAQGGTPPYHSWQVTSGELPAGMALDSATGILAGSAAEEEKLYYFVVQVSDSAREPETAQETFGVRVGDPSQPGPLLQKARAYQEIYLTRHNCDGLSVTADQPDDPNGDYWFSDMGDACFIHGNASAGAAFRYAVEPTEENLDVVRLHVRGLDLLNRVNGVPGLMSRSYAPQDAPFNPNEFTEFWPITEDHIGEGEFADYYWKGDVSIDQYSGALVGLALTYDLVADEEVREIVRRTIVEIADYLWAGDLIIYDVDGEPTTYGDFRGNYLEGVPVSNGLTSAACLAWFQLAYRVSGDEKYQDIFDELAYERHYIWNIEHFLWVYLGPFTKHYNVYMGYENMYTLTRQSEDPDLHEIFSNAFQRQLWDSGPGLLFRRGGVEANPTFTSWYLNATGRRDPEAVRLSIWEMDVFVPAPLRDHYVHNSDNPDIEHNPLFPDEALYPLPANLRVPDMCIWHRTPYSLDGGEDNGRERTGHDYLLPYWMMRYYGYLSPGW